MATPAAGGTVPHGDTGKRGDPRGAPCRMATPGRCRMATPGNYAARVMIGAPSRRGRGFPSSFVFLASAAMRSASSMSLILRQVLTGGSLLTWR